MKRNDHVTAAERSRMLALAQEGLFYAEIGKELGRSRATICLTLRAMGYCRGKGRGKAGNARPVVHAEPAAKQAMKLPTAGLFWTPSPAQLMGGRNPGMPLSLSGGRVRGVG